MPDDSKKFTPINYLNREFNGIRQDLIDLAQRYYPDQFQDFSESSFAALMIDSVAYVGDQLSLYLDYNVNESFLDTAFERKNILRHGRILGFKDTGRPSTYGTVAVYVMVPADSAGLGPDQRYIPLMRRGSSFGTTTGLAFVLTENIDFNNPKNDIVVARVDQSTGAPTYYAIKAYGNVVSGQFGVKSLTVGNYQKFQRLKLSNPNIVEIISVFDSEGNQYYEVDYLAQDMVYKEIKNNNYQNDNVPSILKPLLVSRKFVVERDRNDVYLQFGSGKASESNVVAIPQNVAMNVYGKSYITDTTFDPTRLSKNVNYGIVPANTTLLVGYRSQSPFDSNIAVGGINTIGNALLEFKDMTSLNRGLMNEVQSSVEVSNELPIVGNVSNPSSGEIKRRIFDTFPTQNRAVTQADYENLAYRMPAKFGSIKRVSVQKDQNSLKRNLNMYVISEDSFGKLTKTNTTIKNNLKTWLNEYRMVNDTIDMLDPYIINLGIEFVIKPTAKTNKNTALQRAIQALQENFAEGFFIGEPIYISDVYSVLKNVEGILDVTKVKIVNKVGAKYSTAAYNVNKNLSPDGSYLIAPANGIFEIKYPTNDIKGKVV